MKVFWGLLPAVITLPLVLPAQAPEVELEPVKTTVTVRAQVETPVASFVSTMNADSLESRPGVNLDDRLRDVPGFSLFRRSSSFVSHPTSQGVSLRGIGTNAASRTLVLFDGIPVNDPFGGWVYWTRFNPDTIDTIEIVRGASNSVYGDRAMGGMLNIMTPAPDARHAWMAVEGGNVGIAEARGGYSDVFGKFGVSTSARGFRSDGYYIVPEEIRGPVDTKADMDFVVGDVRADYFGGRQHFSLRANVLAEQRQNGTQLRDNSSTIGTFGGSYRLGGFSANAYHSRGKLFSSFTGVNATHDVETLTLLQKVTSEDTGGSVLWNGSTRNVNWLVGADAHRASGVSRETVVLAGIQRTPGGRLWQQGVFVQSDVALGSRTRVYGGLRHDFTDRGNDFWSPRGGIAYSDGPRRWRASAYRSFRAPTLNEFFRDFRVGNVTTRGNADLRPETTVGVDAGLDWNFSSLITRTTLFWQTIDELIGNVTLVSGAQPIRQRQNIGEATARGVEFEVQKAFRAFRVEGAYLFADSQLDTNVWMPQTPKHQGSFQVLYSSGRTLVSAGIRAYSLQFEDDLNEFLLPGFASVQFQVQHRFGRGFSGLLGVENLLDKEYLAGFTPEPVIGAPRLIRVGVKWETGR
ncbi:MAG: TonB-dependent receptor [Bryobacterales bacterium]